MKTVRLPAIYRGATPRVDRSFKLTFETRELSSETVSDLHSVFMAECWLLVAPSSDALDSVDVPAVKPDAGVARKTPSQRLRAVIFIYWQQLGRPGDFETFYNQRIERQIEQYKARLDGEELTA